MSVKIKPYYCPNCNKFKKSRDVQFSNCGFTPYCKYCSDECVVVERVVEFMLKRGMIDISTRECSDTYIDGHLVNNVTMFDAIHKNNKPL